MKEKGFHIAEIAPPMIDVHVSFDLLLVVREQVMRTSFTFLFAIKLNGVNANK